jgi:hypothetical protein
MELKYGNILRVLTNPLFLLLTVTGLGLTFASYSFVSAVSQPSVNQRLDKNPSTAFSEADDADSQPTPKPAPELTVNGQSVAIPSEGEAQQEITDSSGNTSVHVSSESVTNNSSHSTHIEITTDNNGTRNEIRYEE